MSTADFILFDGDTAILAGCCLREPESKRRASELRILVLAAGEPQSLEAIAVIKYQGF